MALFNYANREITAKLVYYGPGMCGKTTSLQYIHERIAPAQRGRLLSLATETDRTIFFDLLPLKLGEILGFKLRFQLYTVPGQVKYNKTRKLVLQGADAIIFVADSQMSCQKENIESFQNLQENLKEQGKKFEDLPLVYAYNKRDLKDVKGVLSIEELNRDLNPRNLPHFPTIATEGDGVLETLEAISKIAIQDIKERLTATTTAETPESTEGVEFSITGEELLDLTSGEEPTDTSLTFSSEELDSLELESDLDVLDSDEEPLETRPIGYNNNIPIEEVEIRQEDVAHTGSLKESEFFNLKEVEEQALRELDEFIAGEIEDESLTFDAFKEDAQPSASGEQEEAAGFTLVESPDVEQSSRFDDSGVDFSFDTGEIGQSDSDQEEGGLDFSFDTGGIEQPASDQEEGGLDLSFDTGGIEQPASDQEETLTLESDTLLEFDLGEESQESASEQGPQESSAQAEIESLDFSESDLDLSFGEEGTEEEEELPSFTLLEEDARGESTSLTTDEGEALEFTLDEESKESASEQGPQESSAQAEIESLDLSESDLDLSFGEEETEEEPSAIEFEASEDQSSEPYDFRITDSVRFEMQHGEEISSVTPFEKQLDELSEDIVTTEEEMPGAEFQPETPEVEEQEQFQAISDESTRLTVGAKHFYQQGEACRTKQTVNDNILAILMYYTAIETELKAVALKYETCNPAIASLKIILDSIEEETGKTISGKKSIMDNIVKIKDNIQLGTVYPDDEACELAARICERFLTTLSQDFLSIDFTELSPVLAKSADD